MTPGAGARPFRRAVRARFDRAAGTYADASALETEIAARMLERLSLVRISPGRILDAGAGQQRDIEALQRRSPDASVVALDLSHRMLRSGASRARWPLPWRRRRGQAVCGDLSGTPFADGVFDLLWSNMALHWCADLPRALDECRRVLRPGGLAMFSMLGPDSLKELRRVAGEARVPRPVDMHDIGDLLQRAGWTTPVVDMEMITLTYSSADACLAELRRGGMTYAHRRAGPGTASRTFRTAFLEGLRASSTGGRFAVTFEVLYGHAWVPERVPHAPQPQRVRLHLPRHRND